MKLDSNLCLKVLLDMCKIKYTDKQLVKLENLLSKLYILRTCSVDLGEISQESEEIPQNVEEISQNQDIEDFEIKEETDENFENREVNDTDQNNEDTRDGSQITETVSINPIVETSRNPVVISLKPSTKRKQIQLEDSESGNENSPKKSKSTPVFSCTVCGLKCHSQTLLVQHVHMIHNNVKTLQCVGCEKGMQYILI